MVKVCRLSWDIVRCLLGLVMLFRKYSVLWLEDVDLHCPNCDGILPRLHFVPADAIHHLDVQVRIYSFYYGILKRTLGSGSGDLVRRGDCSLRSGTLSV